MWLVPVYAVFFFVFLIHFLSSQKRYFAAAAIEHIFVDNANLFGLSSLLCLVPCAWYTSYKRMSFSHKCCGMCWCAPDKLFSLAVCWMKAKEMRLLLAKVFGERYSSFLLCMGFVPAGLNSGRSLCTAHIIRTFTHRATAATEAAATAATYLKEYRRLQTLWASNLLIVSDRARMISLFSFFGFVSLYILISPVCPCFSSSSASA